MIPQGPLVWIDLEMTGLTLERHTIIEIAALITDKDLEIIAEGPDIAIRQPEAILESMDDWSRNQHSASGLLDRVLGSKYDMAGAEKEILDFLKPFCSRHGSPLCGNSVWQDRRFLAVYMPELESFLHYRVIDVSTLKELVRRWYPDLPPFEKKKTHLAVNDIKESVAELKYYRNSVFLKR